MKASFKLTHARTRRCIKAQLKAMQAGHMDLGSSTDTVVDFARSERIRPRIKSPGRS